MTDPVDRTAGASAKKRKHLVAVAVIAVLIAGVVYGTQMMGDRTKGKETAKVEKTESTTPPPAKTDGSAKSAEPRSGSVKGDPSKSTGSPAAHRGDEPRTKRVKSPKRPVVRGETRRQPGHGKRLKPPKAETDGMPPPVKKPERTPKETPKADDKPAKKDAPKRDDPVKPVKKPERTPKETPKADEKPKPAKKPNPYRNFKESDLLKVLVKTSHRGGKANWWNEQAHEVYLAGWLKALKPKAHLDAVAPLYVALQAVVKADSKGFWPAMKRVWKARYDQLKGKKKLTKGELIESEWLDVLVKKGWTGRWWRFRNRMKYVWQARLMQLGEQPAKPKPLNPRIAMQQCLRMLSDSVQRGGYNSKAHYAYLEWRIDGLKQMKSRTDAQNELLKRLQKALKVKSNRFWASLVEVWKQERGMLSLLRTEASRQEVRLLEGLIAAKLKWRVMRPLLQRLWGHRIGQLRS